MEKQKLQIQVARKTRELLEAQKITLHHLGFVCYFFKYHNLEFKWKDAAEKTGVAYSVLRKIAKELEAVNLLVRIKRKYGIQLRFTPENCHPELCSKNNNSISYVQRHMHTIKEILEDMKKVSGRTFSMYVKDTQNKIIARLKEGYSVENFKTVNRNMLKWLDDPNMSEFYRPHTLYGEKFDGYLQATPVI